MQKATVFKSNKSQAIRIPKALELPESVKQVEIIPLGRARLIVPVGERWDTFFEAEPASEDFMAERDQPKPQEREEF